MARARRACQQKLNRAANRHKKRKVEKMKTYNELTQTQKELYLYATNCGKLYGMRVCVEKCLAKRKIKGIFNVQKASKAYRGFVDQAAKCYHNLFCCDAEYTVFTVADRIAVCEALVVQFEEEFTCGNYAQ
jgi:hypothetical protein